MNQSEVMMELLRSALLDKEPRLSANQKVDWDNLMDMSAAQGVLAWVWDGICKLPKEQHPPRLQSINWGLSAQEVWDKYALQSSVLEKMVSICKENDIRLLLLKGIGLSRLYPKPESRPSGDIDIYLFEDYEKGNLLLAGHNVDRIDKHATFMIDGVLVENHYYFFEPNTKQKKRIINYLKASLEDVRLTNFGYFVLPPMAECVFLTLHTLKHFTEETLLPLKNIVDFAMYLNVYRSSINPDTCLKTMEELGLGKGFEMLVCMSEVIMGIDYSLYIANRLPSKDISEMKKLLLTDYATLAEDCNRLFYRRPEARCVSRYIPRNTSYIGAVCRFFSQILRWLFPIPKKMSIKTWLKERNRK